MPAASDLPAAAAAVVVPADVLVVDVESAVADAATASVPAGVEAATAVAMALVPLPQRVERGAAFVLIRGRVQGGSLVAVLSGWVFGTTPNRGVFYAFRPRDDYRRDDVLGR